MKIRAGPFCLKSLQRVNPIVIERRSKIIDNRDRLFKGVETMLCVGLGRKRPAYCVERKVNGNRRTAGSRWNGAQ